jgi:hypothetical protein
MDDTSWEDGEDDDRELDDEEQDRLALQQEIWDEGQEDDEGEEDSKPERKILHLSRTCYFPKGIRGILMPHLREISYLLSENSDPVEEFKVLDWIARRAPILPGLREFEAVKAYWPEARQELLDSMSMLGGDADWGDVLKVNGWRIDLKILRMAMWASPRTAPLTMRAWNRAFGEDREFHALHDVKRFWRIKSDLERMSPEGREAYKARDALRRKSRGRIEYLQDYRSNPAFKQQEAERKRLARAARRPKDQAAE